MRKPIEDLSKLFKKLRKSKTFLKKRDQYFKNYLGGEKMGWENWEKSLENFKCDDVFDLKML